MPFPPGGSVDMLGRLLAQRMQENWGQTVIVENRPGAAHHDRHRGGRQGRSGRLHADHRGEHPRHQSGAADQDAVRRLKDFEPIALLARTPVVLYAHPSFPAKDLKELVALGKAKTHTLNFGSAGIGSMTHLTGEMLKSWPASRCCTSSIAAARRR